MDGMLNLSTVGILAPYIGGGKVLMRVETRGRGQKEGTSDVMQCDISQLHYS